MFHLKLKVKYNTGYFASKNPCRLCEAKRNAHLHVSLRANVVYYGLKVSSEEFKLPFAKLGLAALKIKTRVCFADLKGRPCFLFCAAIFWSWRGVKNFLEPSKIRFKRGFFFFFYDKSTANIKKHCRSHYVFLFWETCKCAFLFRNEKINFKK